MSTRGNSEAPSHCVDAVVRDALESQRSHGLLPQVNEVTRYVRGIVERLDAKQAERKQTPAVEPEREVIDSRDDPALEREYRTRLRRRGETPLDGHWVMTRTLDSARPAKDPGTLMAHAEKRLRARIRLIRSKADWAAKLRRINPLALQGALGEEKQREAANHVRQVITDSERLWGAWYKEPPKRLFFS